MPSECQLLSLLDYKTNILIPPDFTGGETPSGTIIIDENNVITMEVYFPEQKVYTGGETEDSTVIVDENGVILVNVNYPEPIIYTGGETLSGTIVIDENNVITLNVNHPDIPEQVYYYGGTSSDVEVKIDENNIITAELIPQNMHQDTEWITPSEFLNGFEGDATSIPRYRIYNDVLYLAGAIIGGEDNSIVFEMPEIPSIAIDYTRNMVTQTNDITCSKLNIETDENGMVTLFAEVKGSKLTSLEMTVPLF